ncbi:hypothetical protein Y09_2561 [Brachybacterium sp. SW0106-09]|nr:hypothetical protein Y09_2561 [Brachybacterium sp. SW0106-09]
MREHLADLRRGGVGRSGNGQGGSSSVDLCAGGTAALVGSRRPSSNSARPCGTGP